MLLAILASLPFRSVPFGQVAAPQAAPAVQSAPNPARLEADVCNYITTRLGLLERGAALKELKSELTGEIDLRTLPPRSVEFLKRMTLLCDKALANQAQVQPQLAALDAPPSTANAGALAGTGTTLLTESTPTIVSALARLPQSTEANSARSALLARTDGSPNAEIAALKRDLAAFRAQVQAEGKLPSTDLVDPADCDRFLESADKTSESDRVAGVSDALEKSPRMQPAALHLATLFLRAGDLERSVAYADQVIEQAPQILGRDPLRARAYLFKAFAASSAGDSKSAVEFADLGLKDDPASPALLLVQAEAVAGSGRHPEALPLFEKLAVLLPQNPSVSYDLARCSAVVKKDPAAALQQFRLALDRGFADIGRAKQDPDLALLRDAKSAEFRSLTTLSVELAVDWHTLTPHGILITNASRFTLSDVTLTLTISNRASPGASRKSVKLERALVLDGLAPGEKRYFPGVLHTTRDQLGTLQVLAEGPQGRFDVVYQAKDLPDRPIRLPRTAQASN
jgi:tetratricopeptide (TPR) repeat protein